jgi:hypothetical protein
MKTRTWLIAGLISLSMPVSAGNLFQPVELSDKELAQLRGRYVLPDRIIHFGVTMNTIWQNSAGQTVGALVSLRVDGVAEPSLHVSFTDQPGNGTSIAAGTGQVLGGAGLSNVDGIVQSVRSAGDYNDGLNDLSIVVTNGNSALPAAAGVSWSGSGAFSNAAGDVTVSSQAGGLQIALQAAGQGAALQQIGSTGISQQTSINGSLNTVRNIAALTVALRDRPMGLDLANCTWEQMHALRPTGY